MVLSDVLHELGLRKGASGTVPFRWFGRAQMEGTQDTASRRGPTDSHHLLCWCRYPWKHSLPPEGQPRCRPSRSSRNPDTSTRTVFDAILSQITTLSSWHTTTGRPLTSTLPAQPIVLVWQSLCTPRCPSPSHHTHHTHPCMHIAIPGWVVAVQAAFACTAPSRPSSFPCPSF